MSLKHNKKTNSAIVFEQLVKVATRLALENKKKEAKDIIDLIKKYYKNESNLGKERKLIFSLVEKRNVPQEEANEILFECLSEAKHINEKKLQEEKNNLLSYINKNLGKEFYSIPVENYKFLASVQILFNEERNKYKNTTPQERIKIKKEIISNLSEETSKAMVCKQLFQTS